MFTITIIIFAITAVAGLILAVKIFSGKQAPWSISIIHALFGATGLVVLIYQLFIEGPASSRAVAALGLLVVAALGGFYLASIHFRGKVAKKSIVMIHAGVAVAGFLTLLSVVLGI